MSAVMLFESVRIDHVVWTRSNTTRSIGGDCPLLISHLKDCKKVPPSYIIGKLEPSQFFPVLAKNCGLDPGLSVFFQKSLKHYSWKTSMKEYIILCIKKARKSGIYSFNHRRSHLMSTPQNAIFPFTKKPKGILDGFDPASTISFIDPLTKMFIFHESLFFQEFPPLLLRENKN